MTESGDADYTAIPGHLLPEKLGDDAGAWAVAFCQHAEKLGHTIDTGWMIGWFANAIEASWERRVRRAQPQTKPTTGAGTAISAFCVPKNVEAK